MRLVRWENFLPVQQWELCNCPVLMLDRLRLGNLNSHEGLARCHWMWPKQSVCNCWSHFCNQVMWWFLLSHFYSFIRGFFLCDPVTKLSRLARFFAWIFFSSTFNEGCKLNLLFHLVTKWSRDAQIIPMFIVTLKAIFKIKHGVGSSPTDTKETHVSIRWRI